MDRDNSDEGEIIANTVEHEEVLVTFRVVDENSGASDMIGTRIHAGFVPRFAVDESSLCQSKKHRTEATATK